MMVYIYIYIVLVYYKWVFFFIFFIVPFCLEHIGKPFIYIGFGFSRDDSHVCN